MAVNSSRYLMSDKMQLFEPYFRLRDAIFAQALEDWLSASPKAREYLQDKYAKLPAWRRAEVKLLAKEKRLKWFNAAETWDFFHDGWADKLLVDTPYTGAEVWDMMLTGSWNRGGQKDKPYRIPQMPTTTECAKPIDKRFGECVLERNTFLFTLAAVEKQARKRANRHRQEKEDL